ncbi:MAG: electron transport complex subunit RsxG [Pseudomonadota bacterium]|jgi:electron transport complex protein RnfG
MSAPVFRHAARIAAVLAAFAILGTAVLAATYTATRDIIALTEKKAKLALLGQILPRDLYDNDLIGDAAQLPAASELGNTGPTPVYRAMLAGKPAAAVIEAVAPDGYSGKIKLLVAIRADGTVSGVRVLAHNETPGLGDYIDIAKSGWIRIFEGMSLSKLPETGWKVRKDGGKFDHMAGATVTPRAVVKAVRKALAYFAQNREQIFALPALPQEQQK